MDTREKIISLADLPAHLANTQWQAITGLFDPLTLTQAERIAASNGAKVLAIVDPGQGTLLGAKARASLVAALRRVRLVVIASPEEWQPVLAKWANVQIDHDESADRARSAEFANYILERQSS